MADRRSDQTDIGRPDVPAYAYRENGLLTSGRVYELSKRQKDNDAFLCEARLWAISA
jgi:hypothetical protein